MSHTKGNWKHCIQPDLIGLVDTVNVGSKRIATLQKHEESAYDAQLIAAAPDLLSALISAQKMIYELGDSYCRDKEGYLKPTAAKNGWDADTEIKIGMAIRKATEND